MADSSILDVHSIFQATTNANMNNRQAVVNRFRAVNEEMLSLTSSAVSLTTITPNTLQYYSDLKKTEKYEAISKSVEQKKSTYTPPKEEKKSTNETNAEEESDKIELTPQEAYRYAGQQSKLYTQALSANQFSSSFSTIA